MESIENKVKVLCVEDEILVVNYISEVLDKNKYEISHINNGQKALDFLLETTNPPDIILLDNYLPSLDGLNILRQLKVHGKAFAIIFLTIDETLETAVEAMKEGALDYLTKNYLKVELNIKIERAYKVYQERIQKEYFEQQHTLLSLAVQQSPNSMVLTDTSGNIEYVNNQFTKNTGYTYEEAIGKNPRILKTNNYPSGFFDKLWQTITSDKTWKGEFVNKKKNGEIFYEKAIISPLHDKAGKIISFLAVKEDITELKKAELALKEVTNEMNHFFTVVVDLLCVIDNVTWNFVRLNKGWENLLGYEQAEILGKPFIEFVHPDDIESTRAAAEELEKTGRLMNFINRYRCKDGSYKYLEWSCIAAEYGSYYSFASDITSRKLSEQALKESEDRFRSIFQMTNAGIFFSDENGQIVMINNALLNMLEYTDDELYQMDFHQFTHLDDLSKENELFKDLMTSKKNQYRIEKRYVSKSGETIWVDLALSVIRDEDKKPIFYVGIVNDITDRKNYELQLRENNVTRDKFFSIISHDLRGQFSVLRGFAELLQLKDSKYTETDRVKFVDSLYSVATNGLALLEDLLEWSRLQLNKLEFKPEKLLLSELIADPLLVLMNQAALKNIVIVNNIKKEHYIFADKHMIITVVRNLVSNAIKFTPTGGKITIYSISEENFDILSVKDTGVGMPKDVIENLFRIDYKHSTTGTEREKGTGLGLILCKEFIDKHNGKIQVRSKIDSGSEFIVSIPVNVPH
jgi:PAS domain S-box-containing protein